MSAEESELSGNRQPWKGGAEAASCKQNSRPHHKRKQPCLSQYFPTLPDNSRGLLSKRKKGGGITVTMRRPNSASSPPPSWRICNLFLKSSFSARKMNVCPFPTGEFLANTKNGALAFSLGSNVKGLNCGICSLFSFFFLLPFFPSLLVNPASPWVVINARPKILHTVRREQFLASPTLLSDNPCEIILWEVRNRKNSVKGCLPREAFCLNWVFCCPKKAKACFWNWKYWGLQVFTQLLILVVWRQVPLTTFLIKETELGNY